MFVNRAHPPPPRFGKFSSTARWKALKSLYCTIRRLFVDYSRTIRTIRRLYADYSYCSFHIQFIVFPIPLVLIYKHVYQHGKCFIFAKENTFNFGLYDL